MRMLRLSQLNNQAGLQGIALSFRKPWISPPGRARDSGRLPSCRTGAGRQLCMCGSSRNPDLRRSMFVATTQLQNLQFSLRLAWRPYKGLLPFLRLVSLEDTRHQSLFPFGNSCKAPQVFEPPPHYTSGVLWRASRCGPGHLIDGVASLLWRCLLESAPRGKLMTKVKGL